MHAEGEPSEWVTRWASTLAPGSALDVACGAGRHSRWLAGRDWKVTAVDQAPGLPPTAGVSVVAADLEGDAAPPWARGSFDLVVVTNYLHRPLFPDLLAALVPGGMLLYETFMVGHPGRPSRPEFLLQPGELVERCTSLEIIEYRAGRRPGSESVTQSIAARRPLT